MPKKSLRSEGFIISNPEHHKIENKIISINKPGDSSSVGYFSNYCGIGPDKPIVTPQHNTDFCCYYHDTSFDYTRRKYYISDYIKYLDTGEADDQFLACLDKFKPSFVNKPREWLVNRASYQIFNFKKKLPLGSVRYFRKPVDIPKFKRPEFLEPLVPESPRRRRFEIDLLESPSSPKRKQPLRIDKDYIKNTKKNLNHGFDTIAEKTLFSKKLNFQKAKVNATFKIPKYKRIPFKKKTKSRFKKKIWPSFKKTFKKTF